MNVSFKFEDVGNSVFGHIYRPIAKVNLASPSSENKIDVWMIIDTGADYTILPRHISQILRISLEQDCISDTTFGIGGNQKIYFYKAKVTAKIGKLERKIPLAFFDSNEVPALLGRLGFLETFTTHFLKSHTVVFEEWSPTGLPANSSLA